MVININSSFGDLVVEDVTLKEEEWIVVKSQSISYDKPSFIIKQFNTDFPSYTVLGTNDMEKFTFINELCARQPALRKWFAAVSVKYSDTTQLPLYLQDRVAPDQYKTILENLLNMKDELADIVKARNDLAVKYSADLESLRKREESIVKKSVGGDNIMGIINLTTEALPLSLQMKIQSYDVKTVDIDLADSKRRLAQEYLVKFKIALLDFVKENPEVNLDNLINEIQLK